MIFWVKQASASFSRWIWNKTLLFIIINLDFVKNKDMNENCEVL